YRIEEYREIVSTYIKEDVGIYDDTPELNRAIAWADAYYGDHSSLVNLFEEAGKKVLIQSVSVMEDI
ncbi:MAG: hypothetical protein IJV71_05170, partial [Lachnospiraceae bacterium]|nr:hypothetical protein [Lachnospiraceae bacterium]